MSYKLNPITGKLDYYNNSIEIQAACSDLTTPITVSTDKVYIPIAANFTLTEVIAFLSTPQVSGSLFTVDIKLNGVSILSTLITIENGDNSSVTATIPPVISTTIISKNDIVTVDVTQIGDGTGAGLIVTLIGIR
jgi:hypothetical protein